MPTEGHRPPRDELNSKNVSMIVTTVLDAPPDLPFPEDLLDDDDDLTEAAELVVVATDAVDSEMTAFPPFPPFPVDLAVELENGARVADAMLVVASADDEDEVETTSATDVVDEPFPPLPPFPPLFPVALAVESDDEAMLAEAPEASFVLAAATLEELSVALEAALETTKSGPAATALAAKAAAA